MTESQSRSKKIINELFSHENLDSLADKLRPHFPNEKPLPPRITSTTDHSYEGVIKRHQLLNASGISVEELSANKYLKQPEKFSNNIENLIGFSAIPVGVIGPLRINGTYACGDFYVPLATCEGALVPSYHRGATIVSQAGGASAILLNEAVSRAPCFVFENMRDAGWFLSFVISISEQFQAIVAKTSNHCQFLDLKTSIIGKEVYLIFEFTTGDAAGQNMVTLATKALCQAILQQTPVAPLNWFLEANLSGDKKATMAAFNSVRGKKVVAEVTIPEKLIQRYLHTSPQAMLRYWNLSSLGGVQSGSIGTQGHYANALAALFIACGQDCACVSEASVGITRMDLINNDLYVSVSMPNLIVGTVGGGTSLPTAHECLSMLDCVGNGNARKFAEICAVTALAGEISIIGSMSAGDFATAHQQYGRQEL